MVQYNEYHKDSHSQSRALSALALNAEKRNSLLYCELFAIKQAVIMIDNKKVLIMLLGLSWIACGPRESPPPTEQTKVNGIKLRLDPPSGNHLHLFSGRDTFNQGKCHLRVMSTQGQFDQLSEFRVLVQASLSGSSSSARRAGTCKHHHHGHDDECHQHGCEPEHSSLEKYLPNGELLYHAIHPQHFYWESPVEGISHFKVFLAPGATSIEQLTGYDLQFVEQLPDGRVKTRRVICENLTIQSNTPPGSVTDPTHPQCTCHDHECDDHH